MNVVGLLVALAVGAAPVERGVLPLNGAKLAYEVAGKGPAIVLIHAGVADMSVWDEPFAALTKRFRVLRYDMRGFGRSDTEGVTFSNRADLLAIMNHVKMQRAVIVGNSVGGQIALDFALENPSRVIGVISVSGGVSGFDKTQEGAALKTPPREKAVFDRIDALYQKKDIEHAAKLESSVWASGPEQKPDRAPAAIRERLRRLILQNSRRHTTEPKAIPLDPPAATRLAELKVPVLVMVGEDDESATRAMAEYLASHAPHARKIAYANTAHMISLERPAAFIREVTAFTLEAARGK